MIDKINKNSHLLFLDVETAHWYDAKKTQLSLIQIIDENYPSKVILLDVYNSPKTIDIFRDCIMHNPKIKKVFHNAKFDCTWFDIRNHDKIIRYNIVCTLEMVREIPFILTRNLQLYTLYEYFVMIDNLLYDIKEDCKFKISKVEKIKLQKAEWGIRPIPMNMLTYAAFDVIMLRRVYHGLVHQKEVVKYELDSLVKKKILEQEYLRMRAQIQSAQKMLKLMEKKILECAPIEGLITIEKHQREQVYGMISKLNADYDFKVRIRKSDVKYLSKESQKKLEKKIISYKYIKKTK